MNLSEIVAEIRRHTIFYRHSGGGITYSGGEPTVQLDFLRRMVETFRGMGIHQTIETCGYFSWEKACHIFEQLDAIFVNLKIVDPSMHQKLTGCPNSLILENIRHMGKLGIPVVVRIPLVPDINDSEENLKASAEFVRQTLPGGKMEILPYHRLGLEKYEKLELEEFRYVYRPPTDSEIESARNLIEFCGVATTSYQ